MIIVWAILFITVLDLFLYPTWGKRYENFIINPYRVFQSGLKLGVSLFLLNYWGWAYVICFNLAWMTWLDDILFYLLYDAAGLFFARPSALIAEVVSNKVNWDKFTFVGLAKLIIGDNSPTKWQWLFLQALIGISTIIIVLNLTQ